MDEDSIIIQLELRNMARVMADLKRLSTQLKQLKQDTGMGGSRAAFDPNKTVRMAAGGGNYGGPKQALQAAQITQKMVRQYGGPNQSLQAVKMMARMSSRGGGGMGAMMGGGMNIAAMLGPEAVAVAAVAVAAVAAAVAIGEMAKSAAEAGVAFMKIGLMSGGTTQQTGQLAVLGNALGGVDMGSLSRTFADTISRGLAAGTAQRYGIKDYGEIDPDINKAKKLLDGIKALRGMTLHDAQYYARIWKIETVLPLRNLSDKTMDNLTADSGLKTSIMTPQFQKDALEFQTAMARMTDSFSNLMTAVMKPFLPGLTKMVDGLTEWINGMAAFANRNASLIKVLWAATGFENIFSIIGGAFRIFGSIMKPLISVIESSFGGLGPLGEKMAGFAKVFFNPLGSALNWIADFLDTHQNQIKGIAEVMKGVVEMIFGQFGQGFKDYQQGIKDFQTPDAKKDHTTAIDRNTDALNANTYARNGTYGGGERARGAVPSKWNGLHPELYVQGAARLGAFAL